MDDIHVDRMDHDEKNSNYYDEIEIEDMDYDEKTQVYTYPCPCGSKFIIKKSELEDGEEIAKCPDCPLYIHVLYDSDDFSHDEEEEEEQDDD